MLSVNLSGINNKFFIMNNSNKSAGQVPKTPYFDTMKAATVAMFNICREKHATNLYNMSQREYQELTA